MLKLQIDAASLSWGAMLDLEEAEGSFFGITNWLVKYAGADMDELRAVPLHEISEVRSQLEAQINKAVLVPKPKGRRSS